MPEGVEIRNAKAGDIAFVIGLWQGMMEESGRADERLEAKEGAEVIWARWAGERMRDQNSIVLVAEKEGGLVGYCMAYVEKSLPVHKMKEHGYISDVYVDESERGKGLASELVRRMLDFFREKGVKAVQITVAVRNEKAQKFWGKLGFADFTNRMWLDL